MPCSEPEDTARQKLRCCIPSTNVTPRSLPKGRTNRINPTGESSRDGLSIRPLGEVLCFDVTCDVIAVCAWYCVYLSIYRPMYIIASKAHRPIGIWSGCMYANRQRGAVMGLPCNPPSGTAPASGGWGRLLRRKVNNDEPKGKVWQSSKWSLSFMFVVPPHHQTQSKYGTNTRPMT